MTFCVYNNEIYLKFQINRWWIEKEKNERKKKNTTDANEIKQNGQPIKFLIFSL